MTRHHESFVDDPWHELGLEVEATLNLRSVIAQVGDASLPIDFRTPQSRYLEEVCGRIDSAKVVDLTKATYEARVLTRPVG